MGKRLKLREAQRRAAEQAIAARLRAHAPAKTAPAFIDSFSDFDPDFRDRITRYGELALRAPQAWRCRLRVRSPELRFRDLLRFTFTDYPVATHLENAWIDEAAANVEWAVPHGDELDATVVRPDFRLWYILAGRGESLYRAATHPYMSRLETHHFLTAPAAIATPARAFWYAFSRASTDDAGVAVRVARSKLVRFPATSPFWKEVTGFFTRNPVAINEMNDLIDYIAAMRREDPAYSLRGRSIAALRQRMLHWHRLLSEIACGARWLGSPLPDAQYEAGCGEQRAVWRFRQIKTGDELAREGARMHHCVASYKDCCIKGLLSIWSLTCEPPAGMVRHCLTIELDSRNAITQCRGFANRTAEPDEAEIIKRWAADYGLVWCAGDR
jgi:hypothetical protein